MCQEIDACKGARELVQALASYQPAFPMAIATSSRYAGVEKKKVRHDAIFRHMTAIVAGDDPAVIKGKPAPIFIWKPHENSMSIQTRVWCLKMHCLECVPEKLPVVML